MAIPQKLKGRYDIKEVLGQGGMGVVFRAYDPVVKRDVALKTLRDAPTRAALQMFYKECEVLAALSHPNIIEIFDIGEYEEEGKSKPFFAMPLLPGATLDKLIRDASHRLTVQRVVEIICQTCRGLHAAHERGLIHRDLKPSNLFVMEDDSVKIIDFGVAHMAEQGMTVTAGAKGTLLYMAPEQLQLKPPTPASDIYSLGVVCYETLTRRRPFEAPTEKDIVEAVLNLSPPPATDLNPAVPQVLSRVIHKAMAKQPFSRYSSAREFAETLQKALRNETIEYFSATRIQPRVERASKAFESGDLQFASEILSELEAEGHIDPAIPPLRRQIEHSRRQKTISQLLESARTRFEQDEYPLALQKIQEVLEIDQANGPALGLRTSIENKLTSQKMEDWFRLAKQHIENQAFSHAREAIQNVLQLKSNEPRAMQLLADVDRMEQDYLRMRKQKDELYQSALDAWNIGEVSSAMTKLERVLELDRQSPESTAADRSASYQNFYNKVRSEHEAIKNSYGQARQFLTDRNFGQALAIANEYLVKYPGHALFQALKFDIEEQQRQELSARIAEIDRQVDGEPDLDRRVNILEQAVAAYPGEPHFDRQLKPMREKRDLVNSIVAKGRYHEERGQFNEAVAQWEILKTIYNQYPGLEFEIERVSKRREQAARAEAKARWAEQIDRAVEAGDFPRAIGLCSSAEAEFPGDAELAQLRALAQQSAERAEEAEKHLAEGQKLCDEGAFDDGIAEMRKALELNPRRVAIRAAVLDRLVDRARALLDTDWRAAEPVIRQALDIDPNNILAKSLRTAVQDHKRDEEVVRCFTQARQLRASGDLEHALVEAEQCLAQYPLDPRLGQLRDILKKELDETKRSSARPADLEALRQLEQDAIAAGQWADVKTVLERAHTIAGRYPDDLEFQNAVAGLEQRLNALSAERKAAVETGLGAATVAGSSTVAVPPAPPARPPEAPPAAQPRPVPPPPAAQQVKTPPAAPKPAAKPPKPAKPVKAAAAAPGGPAGKPMSPAVKWGIIGGAGVAAVILLAVALLPALRRGAPPPSNAIRVDVRTTPPGATIRVNGRVSGTSPFPLEVAQGKYQIDASIEGYQPASTTVELAPGATAPIELTLQPLPQTVRLFSDVPEGKATLDDQPPRDLQDGQVILDGVAEGQHTLKLTGKSGEATIAFELAPGALPKISAPPQVKDVAALLVSNFGNRARIATTLSPARVELDGLPSGEAGPDGLELNSLSPGSHELSVTDGKTNLKKVIEIGPAPALTAFLQSDQNIGTLVVLTGEDGVDIYINGQKYRRQTARGGQIRIQREPREYKIRVAKPGFQEVPEQAVQLTKGEEKRLQFTMVALPTTGRLVLQGVAPGAEVFLDRDSIGTVQPDGGFTAGSVAPGEHSVELRRDRLRSRPVRRAFAAGQTVQLSESELALRPLTGVLRLNITPAGAQVTIARAGAQPQPAAGASHDLEEGTYVVMARATGHVEQSANVQVVAGQTATVNLALSRTVAAKPKPTTVGMEGWEGANAWKSDGGWMVRRGGGWVLFRQMPGPGSYAFNVQVASGGLIRGKHLEWALNYRDDRNYVLFRLEKDEFRRIQSVNGRRTELVKKNHGLNLNDQFLVTIQIDVAADTIIHRVRKGDQWAVLDAWKTSDRNFVEGRFGLNISGRDEVRLSGFSFHPKE